MSVELRLSVVGVWDLVHVSQASSISALSAPLFPLRCFRIGLPVLDWGGRGG